MVDVIFPGMVLINREAIILKGQLFNSFVNFLFLVEPFTPECSIVLSNGSRFTLDTIIESGMMSLQRRKAKKYAGFSILLYIEDIL